MKKNLLLLVLALIGMGGFTACNNEDELLVQEQTETKPVVIRATIGNVSRLALGDSEGGKTKLEWGTGDAFALKIGEQTYTFNWQEGNDFVYANDNGDFPATFADAGIITATYPATAATEGTVQSGKKEDVGNYMQMTAELAVTAGQSTTNLNLNFEHQTSVVEIALEKSDLAGKSVVVDLRTIAESMYLTPADADGVLSFDRDGKLTVYFAVSPTDETIKDWHIGVKDIDGNDYYTATLSEMKLAASKMYKVSKGADALTPSYLVSDDSKTVTAYNAIGLYKWREMATEDPTNKVINLELGDDITLPTEGIGEDSDGPVTGNWTPVGNSTTPYKGNIDGKDKTISNMYIVNKTNTANYQGFLGYGWKGTIKNITFDGAKIVVGKADDPDGGGGYVGVISGASRGNFDNCYVTGSTLKCLGLGAASHTMGGLVGALTPSSGFGKITNSSFNGTIDGRSHVGGIVGELIASIGFNNYFASVTNCIAEGTIEGNDLVGGIAGWSRGYIEECTNNAIVNGANSGGIVGVMDAYACTICCTNNGEITGETYAGAYGTGGIVGQIFNSTTSAVDSEIYVIACRNLNANVTLTGSRKPGGIVGYQDRQLSGVYGSYTVKSKEANAYSACVAFNTNSATNGENKVFDSATGTDLTQDAVDALNTAIENAFTAMNTAPKSPYVSSGNYNTYKDYKWLWTSGSWPVFKAGE